MSTPEPNTRFAVNLPSKAQALLLRSWAEHTGRTTSSLVIYLLESALMEAMDKGHIPHQAIQQMHRYVNSISYPVTHILGSTSEGKNLP